MSTDWCTDAGTASPDAVFGLPVDLATDCCCGVAALAPSIQAGPVALQHAIHRVGTFLLSTKNQSCGIGGAEIVLGSRSRKFRIWLHGYVVF